MPASWGHARALARGGSARPCPLRGKQAGRGAVVARAATQQHRQHRHASHSHERVLRYPTGEVRYIRYPLQQTMEEEDEEAGAWEEAPGLWGPPPAATRRSEASVAATSRAGAGQQRPVGAPVDLQAPAPSSSSTSSSAGGAGSTAALAYLESLFAAAYDAQPDACVEDCYEVLFGCPWVLPRPVFVLAMGSKGVSAAAAAAAQLVEQEDGAQVGSTYTLRTKVVQQGAANELAKLLGKPHLGASLDVAEMRDGVVTFESAEDATRFAALLEQEGHSQVLVAEVDSHKLFRMVGDVKGAVVLLRAGGAFVPAPFQLAAALKKQKAWDDL